MKKETNASINRYASKALILSIMFLLAVTPILSLHYELEYDNASPEVNLTYDNLNRIITKTTDTQKFTYTYDNEMYGTLTNVTTDNYTINFEYDDKNRIKKETVLIDGYEFTREFAYDSGNRAIKQVIANKTITYTHNTQGNVKSIPGFVEDSNYNAFGSILNKEYENNLITNYTYNLENNRLESIKSPSVMGLDYTYDSVGNIMSINDSVGSKLSTMTYDYLDRLATVTINDDNYVYSYNSIGNIKKILKNNESKRFAYNNLVHAPSVINEGEYGLDLHNPHEIDTNSKLRIFEFYLLNEKNSSSNTTFNVDFGDGNNFTGSVNSSSDVIMLVEHNYSNGGDYEVRMNTPQDSEKLDIKFGINAKSLSVLYSNIKRKIFELQVENDVKEEIKNIEWNCSGINSFISTDLTGNDFMVDIIDYYYLTSGQKLFECFISSNDGNDYISKKVFVDDLKVEDYDVLYTNISKRIVSFNAKNYYEDLETNVTITTNNETFSELVNISSNDDVIFIVETDYSKDGNHKFEIDMDANVSETSYIESFKLTGVKIENYLRLENNYTNQILVFDVVNNWNDGEVNWTLNDPNINASFNLSNGESVAVIIENAYTTQGNNKAEIEAVASSYVDKTSDSFEVVPLEISEFENLGSNIFEIVAHNNLNSTQEFNWSLDNIDSQFSMNVTDDVFIIIETNYTDGVYDVDAVIKNNQYNDSESEVIVQ